MLVSVVWLGCAGGQTLQLARPLGSDNAELGVDAAMLSVPDTPAPPLSGPSSTPVAGVSAWWQYGVTEELDVLLRLGSTNEVGLKQTFFQSADGAWAIAGAGRLGAQLLYTEQSPLLLRPQALHVSTVAIGEWRPREGLHVVIAPRATALLGAGAQGAGVQLGASRVVAGISAGMLWRTFRRLSLTGEAGLHSAPPHHAPWVDPGRPAWHVAIGLRFDAPSPARAIDTLLGVGPR